MWEFGSAYRGFGRAGSEKGQMVRRLETSGPSATGGAWSGALLLRRFEDGAPRRSL